MDILWQGLVSLAIALFVGVPLYAWQKRRDSQLTKDIERLRTDLSLAEHKRQLAFDTEVGILREVWTALADLESATVPLVPPMLDFNAAEPAEDRKVRLLEDYNRAANRYVEVYERNRPFYPEAIYTELTRLSTKTLSEALVYRDRTMHPSHQATIEYWDRVVKRRDAIVKDVDAICDAIRERVGTTERAGDH